MANGFARFGLLSTLLFFGQAERHVEAHEVRVGAGMAVPSAAASARGSRLECLGAAVGPIDRCESGVGEDRGRIESDLLILPAHYPTLASNRSIAVFMGYAAVGFYCFEIEAVYRRQTFELPAAC